ncbi:hypothetical protein PENTCL1PPCAC_14914, partial [Pristionchus entomophagus]
MIIHFLYRFWSIRHPKLIALFSNKKFIVAISVYPVMELVLWYLVAYYGTTGEGKAIGKTPLRQEYFRRFGIENKEGWIILNHWEDGEFSVRPFFTLLCVDTIMILSFSIAATLGGLTFYYIMRADAMSLTTRNMQLKLFIAVTAQTLVPFVFVYVPYVFALNFPFFHLPIFHIDEASMMLTSCFPAWDAVIMILLMKDFRDGLIGMVWRKKNKSAQPLSEAWMTTA